MMGQRRRDSSRSLIRELEILPLVSQYIFSLMLFVIRNRKKFTANTYEIKTTQQKNLHQPLANLNKYHKGICYLGIKVYNNLPTHTSIKDISNDLKKFEVKLKQILQLHSFYSLHEYFCYRFS
jgi:hypothetical protein